MKDIEKKNWVGSKHYLHLIHFFVFTFIYQLNLYFVHNSFFLLIQFHMEMAGGIISREEVHFNMIFHCMCVMLCRFLFINLFNFAFHQISKANNKIIFSTTKKKRTKGKQNVFLLLFLGFWLQCRKMFILCMTAHSVRRGVWCANRWEILF